MLESKSRIRLVPEKRWGSSHLKRRRVLAKSKHVHSMGKKRRTQHSAAHTLAMSKPTTQHDEPKQKAPEQEVAAQKVDVSPEEKHGVFEPLPEGPGFILMDDEGEDADRLTTLGSIETVSDEHVLGGQEEAQEKQKVSFFTPSPAIATAGKKEAKGGGELDITFTDEDAHKIGQEVKEENKEPDSIPSGVKPDKKEEASKGEKESVDEQELRRQMGEEGFLESVESKEPVYKKRKSVLGVLGLQYIGGVFGKGGELSAKQQKKLEEKQKQREKTEEKEWQEEAKRREKLLEEHKAKREQEQKQEEKQPHKHVEFRIPKIRKRSGLFAFLRSLNYMGLGRQRTAFIDNLATMMDAGLPLLDALRALQTEANKKPMKKLIGYVIVAIETGSPLWRAMEAQYFFKPQEIAMVRVGEEAGNLVENLQYLAEQEEKDRGLSSKVKTAMIYPIIVLVMLTVIVFGLGLFILPNLVQVLKSLGADLPLTTRIIIAGTEYLSTHSRTIVPSFFGGIFVFAILAKFSPLKVAVQWGLLHTPGVGALIREATLSRFGVVMGGLLQAGVPVTDALSSLVGVTGLARYHRFYTRLLEQVELGDSFATSFEKIRGTKQCLPPSVQQLVVTGEQSGSLTKVMLKIAEIHEKHAASIAEKLPVIIEPMLLIFVGGLVAAIALGVLGPIYSVVGNIGNA